MKHSPPLLPSELLRETTLGPHPHCTLMREHSAKWAFHHVHLNTCEWGQYAGVHLPTRASRQWKHTQDTSSKSRPRGESRKSETKARPPCRQLAGTMLFLEKKNGQLHEGLEGPCPALPPSCPALSTSPQTTGFFLQDPSASEQGAEASLQ